jgi:mRNA interferase MazF
VTFDRFDVVIVPFPFTDRRASKRRPALVLSNPAFAAETGNSVLAMITSAKQSTWPGDADVADLAEAGLPQPCKVRMKLFTLEHRLIIDRIGSLSDPDRRAVTASLAQTIGI